MGIRLPVANILFAPSSPPTQSRRLHAANKFSKALALKLSQDCSGSNPQITRSIYYFLIINYLYGSYIIFWRYGDSNLYPSIVSICPVYTYFSPKNKFQKNGSIPFPLHLPILWNKKRGFVNEISKMAVYFNPAIYNGVLSTWVILTHLEVYQGFCPFFSSNNRSMCVNTKSWKSAGSSLKMLTNLVIFSSGLL